MFLIRFTKDDTNLSTFGRKPIKTGEWYKSGYGGAEGKKLPHQGWSTGTMKNAQRNACVCSESRLSS